MPRCLTCASDWSAGVHDPACRECGGGALTRPCPVCGGACGAVWSRAVTDSHDAREAHWIGACAGPRIRLFCFGYQTPRQVASQRVHPDWDDQDSFGVRVAAADRRRVLALGFAFADAFVARLFAEAGARFAGDAYRWSDVQYAHWIEAADGDGGPLIRSEAEIGAAVAALDVTRLL